MSGDVDRESQPQSFGMMIIVTGQRQLGLTTAAAAELLARLEDRGLASGTAADGPGPAEATSEGAALHASLAAAVGPTTRELFAGLDADDLATTRRVLTQVTERACAAPDVTLRQAGNPGGSTGLTLAGRLPMRRHEGGQGLKVSASVAHGRKRSGCSTA